MKKVFALILALVMVFAMSSVAFAGNITANGGTEQESVKIKLTETTTVYHVTIEWLALEFTYNKESNWDVETHTYKGEAGWANAGVITQAIKATNHSNTGVKVSVTVSPVAEQNDLSFTATPSKLDGVLPSAAADVAYQKANKDAASHTDLIVTFDLKVTGTPIDSTVNGAIIGNATVSVTANP